MSARICRVAALIGVLAWAVPATESAADEKPAADRIAEFLGNKRAEAGALLKLLARGEEIVKADPTRIKRRIELLGGPATPEAFSVAASCSQRNELSRTLLSAERLVSVNHFDSSGMPS